MSAEPIDDLPTDLHFKERGTGSPRQSRRQILGAASLGAVGLVGAACVPNPASPQPKPSTPGGTSTAPTTAGFARHLASRATFGPTRADIDQIRRMGATAWLDQQLAPSKLETAEAMVAGYMTLRNSNEANYAVLKNDSELLYRELDHATLLRAVYSKRQLYEVMCDFWTNHLNIWRQADWLEHLKNRDNETVIRPHALGKFSDMLMASAKSPAMLVYLDNYKSRGDAGYQVNENYGRELCELHTLGIIDGEHVYSEADIVGVAKVLSGWGISWDDGTKHDFKFNGWAHSADAVSILGGAWSRAARPKYNDRVANGLGDGESLIRFLARHPSTARYICHKLAQRFVADDPPPALVARLAATFKRSDTAIAPVLRELFLSPEFASASLNKIKRPIDWLYSALRVTRATIPTDPKGDAAKSLRKMAEGLGQPNFERVSPDGWPERGAHWIGAEGLLKRWEAGATIAKTSDPNKGSVNAAALLPNPLPATNGALVAWLATNQLQVDLSAAQITAICAAVRVTPEAAATQIGSDDGKLRGCLGLLLAHPTFHRR